MKRENVKLVRENLDELTNKFNGALKDCGLEHLSIKRIVLDDVRGGCPKGQHEVTVNVGGAIITKCVPDF